MACKIKLSSVDHATASYIDYILFEVYKMQDLLEIIDPAADDINRECVYEISADELKLVCARFSVEFR